MANAGQSYGIVLPPWNYAADEGSLLERAAGEIGLDHVTIPVVTGAQAQVRLASTRAAPYFQTTGGWHFAPTGPRYAAAGLRPLKAAWLAGADAVGRLRDQAQRLGLAVFLRFDLRAVTGLGEQAPHLRQRNAWGQELPFAGLCVSNPTLRELAQATLEDTRRYEPAGWELVDWATDTAAFGLPQATPAYELLNLCFCPSCRQVAARRDVDPDHAARSVRVLFEELVSGAAPKEADAVVAAFVQARAADNVAWQQRVAASEHDRRVFLLWDRVRPARVGSARPALDLLRYSSADLASLDGAAALAFRAHWPAFGESAALVRYMSQAIRLGVSFFDLEGLDESPGEAVTWCKQAVRLARRTT